MMKFAGGAVLGGLVAAIACCLAAGSVREVIPGLVTGVVLGGYITTAYEPVSKQLRTAMRRSRRRFGASSSEFMQGAEITSVVLLKLMVPFLVLAITVAGFAMGCISLYSTGPAAAIQQMFNVVAGASSYLGIYIYAVVATLILWSVASGIARMLIARANAGERREKPPAN